VLTIGSLFAGIGGLELGLERAGLGPVLFQAERDPYCRGVLRRHWPDALLLRSVQEVRVGRVPDVDLVCGGFPCQDVSLAGTGRGLEGERSGLWREFARVVRDLRPRFVVVENVAALRGRGLDRVLGDLAASGYDATWDCVPAAAVGAPHRRDRIFVVAWRIPDAERDELREQPERGPSAARAADQGNAEPRGVGAQPLDLAGADGVHGDPGRPRAGAVRGERSAPAELLGCEEGELGDAARSRCEGRTRGRELDEGRDAIARARSEALANADRWRLALERVSAARSSSEPGAPRNVVDGCELPIWPPDSDDLLAWRAVPPAAQPAICGVADVVSDRVQRLRALGNAVAPAVAEVVGRVVSARVAMPSRR
jgi:DNA (cytosine-5)-methyltransferase 1